MGWHGFSRPLFAAPHCLLWCRPAHLIIPVDSEFDDGSFLPLSAAGRAAGWPRNRPVASTERAKVPVSTTEYRSRSMVRLGWLITPLAVASGAWDIWRSLEPEPDVAGVLLGSFGVFVGMICGWVLLIRRHPIVVIRDRAIERPAVVPFRKRSSVEFELIERATLQGSNLALLTRDGLARFGLRALTEDDRQRVLLDVQARVENARAARVKAVGPGD